MNIKQKSIIICIIGGILMLIGTVSGLQIVKLLIGIYFEYGEPYVSLTIGPGLSIFLTVIIIIIFYIIVGGGISVIIGALLVLLNVYKFGKMIISLGSGMGLIGIIIFLTIDMIFISPVNSFGEFLLFILALLLNLYFIGVILTIIGRRKMKKISEPEPNDETFDIKIMDDTAAFENIDKGLKCPMCYTRNPMEAKFCRRCGFEFTDSLVGNL